MSRYTYPVLALFPSAAPCPAISPLFPYTTLFRSMRSTAEVLRLIAVLNDHRAIGSLQSTDDFSERRRIVIDDERDWWRFRRSEEHTSELQSPCNLVCRLLPEKNKQPSVRR